MDPYITLKEIQEELNEYIQQFQIGYFPPMTQLAKLMEEVGELSREITHEYGEKQKKAVEAASSIEEELGDVFIALLIMANSLSIDVTTAFQKNMEKFRKRDYFRFERKDGMKE